MEPMNANAYFNRGACYDNVKSVSLAIADYSKALELDVKAEADKSST